MMTCTPVFAGFHHALRPCRLEDCLIHYGGVLELDTQSCGAVVQRLDVVLSAKPFDYYGNVDAANNLDGASRIRRCGILPWSILRRDYRYKMLGKPATCDNELLFLFRLSDFELFVNEGKGKRSRSYLPGDWRDCFGPPPPVEQVEKEYKVDLADGYILTSGR